MYSRILDVLSTAGFDFLLRNENRNCWDEALTGLSYIPVHYSHASIDFLLECRQTQDDFCIDISIILKNKDKLYGVWPLSLSSENDVLKLSSHGMPILPPLFVHSLTDKECKRLTRECLHLLSSLCEACSISRWESAESFKDSCHAGLSPWHLQAMENGAKPGLKHELYTDLDLSCEDIKRKFRKSYKPLINSGSRLWDIGVLNQQGEQSVWEEFHQLYIAAAGRETRSPEAWERQYQAINNGDAFLVYLKDKARQMVGAGFFYMTRDEAVYSVAAYNRALFDKPLGHVVQYRALEEMKAKGLRWYKIGPVVYKSDNPTEKELSIAHFKKGFATHCFPQYCLTQLCHSSNG